VAAPLGRMLRHRIEVPAGPPPAQLPNGPVRPYQAGCGEPGSSSSGAFIGLAAPRTFAMPRAADRLCPVPRLMLALRLNFRVRLPAPLMSSDLRVASLEIYWSSSPNTVANALRFRLEPAHIPIARTPARVPMVWEVVKTGMLALRGRGRNRAWS